MYRTQLAVARPIFSSHDPLFLDYFVHWLPLSAAALMAINDHVLKAVFPGFITGKLSDVLGLFFFPLLLCAIICLIRNFVLARTSPLIWYVSKPLLLFCMAVSSIVFIGIKVSPFLRTELAGLFQMVNLQIAITPDYTDLWALLSNIPCYFFGKRYFKEIF